MNKELEKQIEKLSKEIPEMTEYDKIEITFKKGTVYIIKKTSRKETVKLI